MLEDIDEVLETMWIGDKPPNDIEIQPIEVFAEFGSATHFKGFEALHNIVLNIDDQLLCSNVRMEVWQLYDELRWSFETFQQNVKKLTLNVKRKKFMLSRCNLYAWCRVNTDRVSLQFEYQPPLTKQH